MVAGTKLQQPADEFQDYGGHARTTFLDQYRDAGIEKAFFSIHFPVMKKGPAISLSRPSSFRLSVASISLYSF